MGFIVSSGGDCCKRERRIARRDRGWGVVLLFLALFFVSLDESADILSMQRKLRKMLNFRAPVPNSFSLPRRIHGLAELAYNLWWTWNPDAQRLFSRIDAELWEQNYHKPTHFLRQGPL